MSGHGAPLPGDVREAVLDLRRRLGLFSFQYDLQSHDDSLRYGPGPDLVLRPGGIVEWLTAAPGAGAIAATMQMISRHFAAGGILAIVDSARECHVPALSGWGCTLSRTLLVCPRSRQEACWTIEQCLRCPGVSAVWAWVDGRFPTRIHRRWQLAAEVGGGVGMIFRPEAARRESTWADLRLLVTPLAGDQGESRRVRIDILYHRGGLGGTAQVWEIDHAEGVMRVVPPMADPAAAERAAGA
jgi:protein ImuA